MVTTRVAAHYESLRAPLHELVARLQEVLGQRIVAYVAGIKSPRLVGRWAVGGGTTPRQDSQTRLRELWEVVRILDDEGPEVTRAWLLGSNPQLDDKTPVELLREGSSAEVARAAEAFTNH